MSSADRQHSVLSSSNQQQSSFLEPYPQKREAQPKPKPKLAYSRVYVKSYSDHHVVSTTLSQHVQKEQEMVDDGQVYAMRVPATKIDVDRLPQSEEDCLYPTHYNAPRHCLLPGILTRRISAISRTAMFLSGEKLCSSIQPVTGLSEYFRL